MAHAIFLGFYFMYFSEAQIELFKNVLTWDLPWHHRPHGKKIINLSLEALEAH